MGCSLLCDTKVPVSVSELLFFSLLVVLGTTGGNDKWCVGSYLCARVHSSGVACVWLRVSFRAFSRDLVPTEASGCAMSPISAGFGFMGRGEPLPGSGSQAGPAGVGPPTWSGVLCSHVKEEQRVSSLGGTDGQRGPFCTPSLLCVPWGTCLFC